MRMRFKPYARAELMASDFAPFRALADLPMAMTAHIRFTAIDDAPATASRPVIDLIRRDLGFEGLLMSDDIGMQALSGTMAERAAAIVGAGCDLVLSCNETIAQMQNIVAAAGQMTPDARRRADLALGLSQHARGGGLGHADRFRCQLQLTAFGDFMDQTQLTGLQHQAGCGF